MSPQSFAYFVLIAIGLLTAGVHLVFAIAVFLDAATMRHQHGRGTFLVGGAMWALATLLGGLVAVTAYWAIHHSTLRPVLGTQQ